MERTIYLRHDDGRVAGLWNKGHCELWDIVAGNRYRFGAPDAHSIPDEAGDWTALITYRGPNAPERPTVLPVGTKVRRGPDWSAAEIGGNGVGVVTLTDNGEFDDDGWTMVKWPDRTIAVPYAHMLPTGRLSGKSYAHITNLCLLEVLSLPEPKPEAAPVRERRQGRLDRAEPQRREEPTECGIRSAPVVRLDPDTDTIVMVHGQRHTMRGLTLVPLLDQCPACGGCDCTEAECADAPRVNAIVDDCYKRSRFDARRQPHESNPRLFGPTHDLADYTPPAVLARRKTEVRVTVCDNGWDPHD